MLYKPDEGKVPATESPLIPSEESNIRKMTTTESSSLSPEIDNINDKPSINVTSQETQKKFFKSPLTLSLYILFFLQILVLSIYLGIFFHRKPSVKIVENRYNGGKNFQIKNINIQKTSF